MKKSALNLLMVSTFLLIYACGSKKNQDNSEAQDSTATETEANAGTIDLVPVTGSPDFANAILEMNTPEENANLPEGSVKFSYNVKNYQLSSQTDTSGISICANSGKGQHIHLILNNQPYTAHYEAEFEKDLEPGHYVALSFLSRSYHESVKSPEAYVLRQFNVGNADGQEIDLTKPHMFYSRPKGTYTGKDTKNVLLDFFIVNAELSDSGYKVRATINGQEFMFTKWEPKFIQGLPMGTTTIKLEFLDADGNLVDSPYNPVERTITLEAEQQPA